MKKQELGIIMLIIVMVTALMFCADKLHTESMVVDERLRREANDYHEWITECRDCHKYYVKCFTEDPNDGNCTCMVCHEVKEDG